MRIDTAIAAAEYEQRAVNFHHAATLVAIHSVLDEARYSPEVFVGDHASHFNREDIEFAERAAIADLAVRLSLSENTVRAHEHQAVTMIGRTPITWQKFRWGEVSPANARSVSELAASLPDGDDRAFAAFDAAVADPAARLAPARLRVFARTLREKIVADTAAERHESERSHRRVVFEPAIDGMAWISAYLPAEVATAAMTLLDAEALRLSAAPGETRTMPQLRADVLGDMLTGSSVGSVAVRVGVLVPMLTLLGRSEMPASLEGYGPIDAETARRLAGDATSIYRILTDPVTGAILDIDQPTKHIPAGLRRMKQLIDQTCTFPGCGKRAVNCDLDHTIDRQFGGRTTLMNLSHLCRKHHRDKHMTKWAITQDDTGRIEWTSPTGYVAVPDPPPF
ncbi:HNH endonuclease signature motif containing protein [Glaciihabitans sp. GrIS 2.15]|uniref:HNH endonuclease signature motif containing protein n=1 Tax=Glaciihabitans sp. GrIS 2.15 TaxID=3071710 RepID=UPI002E0F6799